MTEAQNENKEYTLFFLVIAKFNSVLKQNTNISLIYYGSTFC